MATALRPIAHDDRLSLVEHLDELRTRIIICLVILTGAFVVCFWQNDRILNIMDRPLQKSAFHKDSQDPLERSAAFQQSLKQLSLQLSLVSREMARSDDISPALQSQFASLSKQAALTAAAAPKASGRRPVTLGVGEPFTVTFKVVGYAALLVSLPFLLWQAYAFVLPAFSPREREIALPLMLMVPFLFIAGVVFAYYMVAAERDQLPAELQRRQLRHPHPGAGLLQVLDHGPGRDGAVVPGPDRHPRGRRAPGSSRRASCARTAATRSSSSPSSPWCCPGRTRSRC